MKSITSDILALFRNLSSSSSSNISCNLLLYLRSKKTSLNNYSITFPSACRPHYQEDQPPMTSLSRGPASYDLTIKRTSLLWPHYQEDQPPL